MWLSRLWTTRDKLIGTLGGMSWVLAGLGVITAEMASSPLSQPGSDSPVGQPPVELQATGPGLLEVVLVAAPFVLPVAAAIYLGYRLRARAAAGASWAPPPS